ncbi:MAG TPA: NADP transhydrogenase subunit alpha [Chloroflexi bacterium]|nr:NADP transhydrogenase subunit alpha [Chloroflexota bacterium]
MIGSKYSVAVLGAGNGGQAIAGLLASQGHSIRLWNRSPDRLNPIKAKGYIDLTGIFSVRGKIDLITECLEECVQDVDIIMVATTADAHRELAQALCPFLQEGQIIVLNPGRTGGALEVRHVFNQYALSQNIYVAEAQSLVFACRIEGPATVRVIGIKDYVPVAALPCRDTEYVLSCIRQLFPCFVSSPHVLYTSFENIGAIFHPTVILFNAAAIERSEEFLFYQDMTPSIAEFLVQLDQERLLLGRSYGIQLLSIFDWLAKAYPDCKGETLVERMRTNPAYAQIKAPTQLQSRLFLEDVPTGLVPFVDFGEAAGLMMPLTRSIVNVSGSLLNREFWKYGRTLERLGLANKDPKDILEYVQK